MLSYAGVAVVVAAGLVAARVLSLLFSSPPPPTPEPKKRDPARLPLVFTPVELSLREACLIHIKPDADAFASVGGLEEVLERMEEALQPLKQRHLLTYSAALQKASGLLLFGPPGTGKTLLARCLAQSAGIPFLSFTPASLQDKYVGQSVKLATAAFTLARKMAPCIMFIDEIDGLLPQRGAFGMSHHTHEFIANFLASWEGVDTAGSDRWVMVVAATNRPEAIDPAALRRMALHLEVPLPGHLAREGILRIQLRREHCAEGLEAALAEVAAGTGGKSGNDLQGIVRRAAQIPVREAWRKEKQERGAGAVAAEGQAVRGITAADLRAVLAMDTPKPTITTFGSGATAQLTPMESMILTACQRKLASLQAAACSGPCAIDSVGGLEGVMARLQEQAVLPLLQPHLLAQSALLMAPTGVLLSGPPGTGKTLLARCLAQSPRSNFLYLNPSTLHSLCVSAPPRPMVAAAFSLARKAAPCLLFLDDLDALLPRRDGACALPAHAQELCASLLCAWEGLGGEAVVGGGAGQGVLVVAASSRPHAIDPAALRLLPCQIELRLPDALARERILRVLLRGERCAGGLRAVLAEVAGGTEGFTGAELQALVKAAAWVPVREAGAGAGAAAKVRGITPADLLAVLSLVRPPGAMPAP